MEHMLKRAYFAQMHKKSQVSLKNLIDKNMGAYPGGIIFRWNSSVWIQTLSESVILHVYMRVEAFVRLGKSEI